MNEKQILKVKNNKVIAQELLEEYNNENAVIQEGVLNQIIYIETRRANGSLRRQQDYQFCPTLTEQHTAHLTDINYLIATHKPDELAAYIAAKNQHRQELIGHDFSAEPSLQDARNITYQLKKSFDELDPEVKNNFKNHVEFLKFIDNPANQDKMLKLGLMTKREIQKNTTTATTTTQEEKAATESKTESSPS